MAYPIIKFLSLQKTELEYEVAIRGNSPASTVQELRKQIAKLGPLFPSEDILTSPFSVTEDLRGVLDAVTKVNTALQLPTVDKSTLLRSQNLLNHLHHRLNRITPDPSTQSSYDDCVKLFKEAVVKCNSLVDTVTDPLSPATSSERSAASSVVPDPINVSVTCEGSSNIFSKLKYDGKTCVRAFIQRVNEFCDAKDIKFEKVMRNATEIFIGDAIHWYRSVKDSISSWEDLMVLLRRDFDQPDFDYRLLSEIRSRTQGEMENIVIYFSVMSGLFSRLTKPLSEEERLEILLHNIRPCYASALSSVSEIKTIESLRLLCRNYENIQSRLSQFKEPPKVSPDMLAPEFAYSGGSSKPKQNLNYNNKFNNNFHNNYNTYKSSSNTHESTNKNVSAPDYVHAVESSTRKPQYCPRCRCNTHNLRQCTASKEKIICFVCGRDGVKTPDCPSCANKRKSPSYSKN